MTEFQPTIPVVYGQPIEVPSSGYARQTEETIRHTKRVEYQKQIERTEKHSKFVEKLVTVVFSVVMFFAIVGAATVYHWVFG